MAQNVRPPDLVIHSARKRCSASLVCRDGDTCGAKTPCREYVVKPVGKPDAGSPHVRFDEGGGETGRLRGTAPVLDSTEICVSKPSTARSSSGRENRDKYRADEFAVAGLSTGPDQCIGRIAYSAENHSVCSAAALSFFVILRAKYLCRGRARVRGKTMEFPGLWTWSLGTDWKVIHYNQTAGKVKRERAPCEPYQHRTEFPRTKDMTT